MPSIANLSETLTPSSAETKVKKMKNNISETAAIESSIKKKEKKSKKIIDVQSDSEKKIKKKRKASSDSDNDEGKSDTSSELIEPKVRFYFFNLFFL